MTKPCFIERSTMAKSGRNLESVVTREPFSRNGPNGAIVMKRGKYLRCYCEARAALDQTCKARAIILIDGAQLCHYHARQAFDREFSEIERLPLDEKYLLSVKPPIL